ncbi:MAG: NADH-quinone oxidoreductase subunit C [Nitriliruptoraceae bacterium]
MSDHHVPSPSTGLAAPPLTLAEIATRLTDRFEQVRTDLAFGELTVHVDPEHLLDVLSFCRDDEELQCALLSDLSGVHWPAGDHEIERQTSTTGWPTYRVSRDIGVIEVLYLLRSVTRNHRLRVSVATPDTDPQLPSATSLFATANFHEREVYDFFGVVFDGHPDLTRILMPDDWLGHPHRKDYPMGGIDIPYKNDKFIPPPQERDLREVID